MIYGVKIKMVMAAIAKNNPGEKFLNIIHPPIVGDTLYGARESAAGTYALHAIQLGFSHPFLNEDIVVKDM
ncbi:hypothetical protein [Solibacillus daqui]|uniref:hypothetical protein n=1 Tax=Solibacillus daqui TaxID=2912187 RepID=UPI002366B331|nr:hypothetical protein [Solibacillus daqui]